MNTAIHPVLLWGIAVTAAIYTIACLGVAIHLRIYSHINFGKKAMSYFTMFGES